MPFVPMRVCIDARGINGAGGGIEQVIVGLASGLSNLQDGSEEFFFLADPKSADYVRPYLQGSCHILVTRKTGAPLGLRRWLASSFPRVRDGFRKVRLYSRGSRWLAVSDGTIENAGIEVMHFPTQNGFVTDVTSIYQPHDLQHLHFPQFFTAADCESRDFTYRSYCHQARLVVAMSEWARSDLIKQYRLAEEKVRVVHGAPVLSAYPTASERDQVDTRNRLCLPEKFILYPAQTWPHKNHAALFEALAIIRDKYSEKVPLVCSGYRNGFFVQLKKRARALGLADQIHFVGFVTSSEIQALYRLCTFVVFPSKFEGLGMPLLESFSVGRPVACSDIPPLAGQSRGAALLFNPDRPDQIADCILRLWHEDKLRRNLVEKGKQVASCFSWERTARLFRAHYRRLSNRCLTEEDRNVLSSPPLF
jgi:glycosyltransferase involved in cell wall biosynthesis